MSKTHDLIIEEGRDAALRSSDDHRVVDIAARFLSDESIGIGITYSGFCMTALPHRRIPDEQSWVRSIPGLSLLVRPGMRPTVPTPRGPDDYEPIGVPYGAKARLILLYLQTQALRDGGPQVKLGRSMNAFLTRMGLSVGGKTYAEVARQAERIGRCSLTFDWTGGNGSGWRNDAIVRDVFRLRRDTDQGDLWDDTVTLSDTFYKALRDHPVPVAEAAVRAISGKSMAIDIYVWLAYRLHVLSRATPITWRALFEQFGNGTAERSFRQEFRMALAAALAVYPDARVDTMEGGLALHPSAPPIPERMMVSA